MKKIVYGALATLSGLVLLFSYRTSLGEAIPTSSTATGTGTTSSGTTGTTGTSGTTSQGASGSGGSTGTTGGGTASSGSSSGLKDGTYTGQAVDTRYGAVQVKISVSGGKITAVDVPQYPNESGRDAEINQQAVPQLVSETLSAQSAQIDMVSGATYTSDGYAQSLQSALDQAAQ